MDSSTALTQHKDFSPVKIRKKIHRISDKSIVVIDESLIRDLSIDEDSWCEQESVSDGILLKICRYEHGQQQREPALTGGKED